MTVSNATGMPVTEDGHLMATDGPGQGVEVEIEKLDLIAAFG